MLKLLIEVFMLELLGMQKEISIAEQEVFVHFLTSLNLSFL